MKALLITGVCDLTKEVRPLTLAEVPRPQPKEKQLLVKLQVCGICHTELDEIEGRLPPAFLPIIPGHQGVGIVAELGKNCSKYKIGDRVGIAWIFSSCGKCGYCKAGLENLCDDFMATGKDANGAYAEYLAIHEDFAFKIPEGMEAVHAAPLLCAGAIGYRSIKLAQIKDGDNIGLMGFGASAHLVVQMLRFLYPSSKIHVFSRTSNEREFALRSGAVWAGGAGEKPPVRLQSIIDTTPAWRPVLDSLKWLDKGGRLIINAIRKEKADQEELLNLSYEQHLWMEKEIKSVANITTADVREFLELAEKAGIKPEVTEYTFEEVNTALLEIKNRKIKGAKVLRISTSG